MSPMPISPDVLYVVMSVVLLFMSVAGFVFTILTIMRQRRHRREEIAALKKTVGDLKHRITRLEKK